MQSIELVVPNLLPFSLTRYQLLLLNDLLQRIV